ncbi:MAG: hypothetical protein K0U84_16005 [Actinomycetia bacterium]|nr:hypothetical protein [Actinomycetes bacterium]
MAKLFFLGLLGGAISAIVAILGNSQSATVLAIGLTLVSIEVMVLTKVAGGFTPVVIPVLIVNSVLLGSLFLWDRIHAEASVSIRLQVSEEYQIQAAVIGIVFSAAYTLGSLLAGPRSVKISLQQLGSSIFQIPNGVLVGVGYGGIILTVYGYQGALLQGQYLEARGPSWAVMLSAALTPLFMLALCIAAARPGPWRMLAVVGIGLLVLILFGRATRRIAALPAMMVLAGAFASGWRVRPRSIVIAAVATVFLMQLPLIGRSNQDGVGIIPLGAQLFTRTDEILAGFSLSAVLGNILFSGPHTAVVAHRPIPSDALWISLNPMPGGIAGWREIEDSLRLNSFTPYNALGELGAHGWVALALVAGAAGFVLSLSTRIASSLPGAYATVAMMIVLIAVALFSINVIQYHLRTTMRFAWYALFGVAAIWVAHGVLGRERAELENQDVLKEPRIPRDAN